MSEQNQIVSLSFHRFVGLGARIWAFTEMLFARAPLARVPGIGFWKLFGSGSGEGFTLIPNTGVYAIMATWPSLEAAQEGLQAPVFQRYRTRACEHWTIFLATNSVRGEWSRKTPFNVSDRTPNGPLAALTRATLRHRTLLKFWKRVPRISQAIGADPNVHFKIGLGEVPGLQQVTFSIWPDADSMAQFARRDGPHAQAIKAVRDGNWFAEELYARFHIVDQMGSWKDARRMTTTSEIKTKEARPA